MSRVHCIDCGVPVVVDPSGLCPDGHFVGTDGARIEAAIGVAVPHPDEPEPWVANVVLDPLPDTDTSPDEVAVTTRVPRPPSAPNETPRPTTDHAGAAAGNAPSPTSAGNGQLSATDTDELLRELHSLSDGSDDAASPPHVQVAARPAAPQAPAAPTAPPTPVAAATSAPAPQPRPPASTSSTLDAPVTPPASPAHEVPMASEGPVAPATDHEGTRTHQDGLAELRALEAAVNALTSGADPDGLAAFADPVVAAPSPAPQDDAVVTRLPSPPQRSQDTPDREKLAEVEELFARRPRPLTEEEAPQQRPSQASPPAEPPRPAFERTPWSSLPAEDLDAPGEGRDAPDGAASPTDRTRATAADEDALGRGAVATPPPSTGGDALDLGNFTARGRRVGRAEAKRRKRNR